MYRVDSISRILSVKDGGIIYLGSTSPPTSSGAPGAFYGAGRSPAPVSPCSRWGLPGHRHHCRCRCALAAPFHPRSVSAAICSLLHLPSGCPARSLTGIDALWSADFPRQALACHDPRDQPGKSILPQFESAWAAGRPPAADLWRRVLVSPFKLA